MANSQKKFSYLSLCSGIGGFELAIARSTKQSRKFHPVCIGYSEINYHARFIYEKHFDHKHLGSVENINYIPIPNLDLVCAGFPCQPFSLAGSRRGLSDERSSVFFEIIRIVKQARPRFLLLENVRGILSQNDGQTFTVIISCLDELGYDIQWQVLNSKDFGVPQNRERVYIVGHLRGTSRPQVFPINCTTETSLKNSEISNSSRREYGFRKIPPTLKARDFKKPELLKLNSPNHSTDRVYHSSGLSPTLTTMQGGGRQPYILHNQNIRRLTPTECERLQGFPDDWTAGLSATQRYCTIGNAVTVPVVEKIITKIITSIELF